MFAKNIWLIRNSNQNVSKSYAAVIRTVRTCNELERALNSKEELQIRLKGNITITKCLRIRGKKILDGAGRYWIRRKMKANGAYKGSLFVMDGENLRLCRIRVDGNSSNKSDESAITGRLLEVNQGAVYLDDGTTLSNNRNKTSLTDGGGAVTVHANGSLYMRKGSSICGNLSITGGSAVRIESGGLFVMEGGMITNNEVAGKGTNSEFDGRGGAIHNRGTVMIKGGGISENYARGYRKGNELFGGYGGALYNQGKCSVTGGVVKENRADFAGGAIYTNQDSQVVMEGGTICNNKAVEMRGGGIYMSAASKVTIRGGLIKDNFAQDGSQIFLGHNNAMGKLILCGGTVSGALDAIYNNGGNIDASGTKVFGDRHGICFMAGNLNMSGEVEINKVYVATGVHLRVHKEISSSTQCVLVPEQYKDGKKLVSIEDKLNPSDVSQHFLLERYKHFKLEVGHRGLYIGREKYKIVFNANHANGEMQPQTCYVGEKSKLSACSFWREGYGFVGWSKKPISRVSHGDIEFEPKAFVKDLEKDENTIILYALWVKKPRISSDSKQMLFYEDEFIGRQQLVYGVIAEDECDGNLTPKIKIERIVMPDQSSGKENDFSTDPKMIGSGYIEYSVANSFDISNSFLQTFDILSNETPSIRALDRYFFVGEADKGDVMDDILLADDVESDEELQHNLKIEWGNIDFQKAGEYQVNVTLRDQFGNRYYMPKGKTDQYGTGKVCKISFVVHICQHEAKDMADEDEGYVRFISFDTVSTLQEHSIWNTPSYQQELGKLDEGKSVVQEKWSFTSQDKADIKRYIHSRSDPFSKETNDLFLDKFARNREILREEKRCVYD